MEFIFTLTSCVFPHWSHSFEMQGIEEICQTRRILSDGKTFGFYLKSSSKPPRKLSANSLLFSIKSFNFNSNFYNPNQFYNKENL